MEGIIRRKLDHFLFHLQSTFARLLKAEVGVPKPGARSSARSIHFASWDELRL